uniref:Uncharacterized protein n=1 Tax=Oryza barthii TaxID=65489 RepID=A0A0D3FJU7_9ORYZ
MLPATVIFKTEKEKRKKENTREHSKHRQSKEARRERERRGLIITNESEGSVDRDKDQLRTRTYVLRCISLQLDPPEFTQFFNPSHPADARRLCSALLLGVWRDREKGEGYSFWRKNNGSKSLPLGGFGIKIASGAAAARAKNQGV